MSRRDELKHGSGPRSGARAEVADERVGAGCLMVFAAPFAAIGLFAAYLFGSALWDWGRMRAWDETPARILEVRLDESRGEDGSTYQVLAQFEYHYRGNRYRGKRVSLSGFNDNVDTFHQDAFRELDRYRRSGESFTAYVNPAEPADAILYRNLRPRLLLIELIFALTFGGVGVGLLIVMRAGVRKSRSEAALRRAYPEEPWKWRDEWQGGRIASGARPKVISSWAFAVFWNLVSAPVALFVPAEIAKGNKLAWLAFLFPAIGVGLLVWAIRTTLRWRKFGHAVFEMSTVPGVLGGVLDGAIVVPHPIDAPGGYELSLSCIKRAKSGSGKNTRTTERVLWQTEQTVDWASARRTDGEFRIPVHFDVPFDQPQTDTGNRSNSVLWRLEARAQVAGVDFHNQFDVPIFRTADSRDDAAPAAQRFKAAPDLDLNAALREARIELVRSQDGRTRLEFPRARHPGIALSWTVFTALWIGSVWLLLALEAPLLFPIVFGLFVLPLAYFTLDSWLGYRRIEATEHSVTITRGWFGEGRTRSFDRADIRNIKVVRGMQAGNRLYHDIKLKPAQGSSLVLANAIRQRQLAEQIKHLLEGLPRPDN